MKRRFFCFGSLTALLPLGMFKKKETDKIPKMGWISVKDRLPNGEFPEDIIPGHPKRCWASSRSILVLCEEVNKQGGRWPDILTLIKDFETGHVWWENYDGKEDYSTDNLEGDEGSSVAYWTELPDWEGEVV